MHLLQRKVEQEVTKHGGDHRDSAVVFEDIRHTFLKNMQTGRKFWFKSSLSATLNNISHFISVNTRKVGFVLREDDDGVIFWNIHYFKSKGHRLTPKGAFPVINFMVYMGTLTPNLFNSSRCS